MAGAGRAGWRGPKNEFGQNMDPIERIFDLTDGFFLAACRTRLGGRTYPNRPKTPHFTQIDVYVGVCVPPFT